MKRCDPKEKEREKIYQQNRRLDPEYSIKEKLFDRQRKLEKTQFNSIKTINDLLPAFHNAISSGCEFVFSCCEQLWFRDSVVPAVKTKDLSYIQWIQGIKSFDNEEYLCHTCRNSINRNSIPKL